MTFADAGIAYGGCPHGHEGNSMTVTADSANAAPAGLFLARFEIGGDLPGAPLLAVTMTVSTPQQTLTGMSRVTQAVNPPVDVTSKLDGDYTYMTVMPNNTHILVVANGYPALPVLQPNLQLRMVLDKDWQSGTANYRYEVDGVWHEVTDAPVKQVG
jgi:hypothetical protein